MIKANKILLTVCLSVTLLIYKSVSAQNCTSPAVGCSNTDFSNSFLKSSNPNTIEYDNMVSTFHSTMARQANGKVLVWGERMNYNGSDHVRTPIELNSTNYPLVGNILRFTAGSRDMTKVQHCVLTTNGLYVWGTPGILVSTQIKSTSGMTRLNISSNATGLPAGVSPGDVKMLFGSYQTLVLVTCNGAVWVLSTTGLKNGDGTDDQASQHIYWHRVRTNQAGNPFLSDVVAVRGSSYSLMALKSDGTVWTWGERCYLGNGTDMAPLTYATPMQNLPGTPKMIGMTQSFDRRENTNIDKHTVTYYMLTTAGRVYSLGSNRSKELGAFLSHTTVPFAEQKNWVQVQKSATSGDFLTNVAWISPQEHDGYYAAINTLTFDGKVYSWGVNALDMLGLGTTFYNDPTPQHVGISATDKIMAVETGGHTTILVKQCTGNYGYVGHKINGSMGDGASGDITVPSYSFSTAALDLCSAPARASIFNTPGIICPGTPITLRTNNNGGSFSILSGNASINSSGTITSVTGPGPVTARYALNVDGCISSADITMQQHDFGNLNPALWTPASATTAANNQAWLGNNFPTAECATNTNDGADGLKIYSAGSPVSGQGTLSNPFIVKGAQTYSFQVTVNGTGVAKPVYWAVWYDVDGNGRFIDDEDVFYTGTVNHNGSAATASFDVTIPITGTALGANTGGIRVVATAEDHILVKGMDGGASLTNGEVEDFYVRYYFPLPVTLANFDAIKNGNKTLLQWSTTSEKNNNGFYIQRSDDSNNWTNLAFENSKASNSNQKIDYSFIDQAPLKGINYYRLKQVDLDGKSEYSYIKQVAFNTNNTISIYPNPANQWVTVNGLAGNETIRLLDITGRVVKTLKASNRSIKITLENLVKGMYHIHIITTNGEVFSEKLIKAK